MPDKATIGAWLRAIVIGHPRIVISLAAITFVAILIAGEDKPSHHSNAIPNAHAASRIIATKLDYWRRSSDERSVERSLVDSRAYVSHCQPLICDNALEAAAIAHCNRMAAERRVFHSDAHNKTCQELVASWDHSDMAKYLEKDQDRTGPIDDPVSRAMMNEVYSVEFYAPLDSPQPEGATKRAEIEAAWERIVTSEVYRLVGAGCCMLPDGTAYICVQLATGTE